MVLLVILFPGDDNNKFYVLFLDLGRGGWFNAEHDREASESCPMMMMMIQTPLCHAPQFFVPAF
jgi:hypothetical protein